MKALIVNSLLVIFAIGGLVSCSETPPSVEAEVSQEPADAPVTAPTTSPTEDLNAYGATFAKNIAGGAVTFKRVDDSNSSMRVNRSDNFTMSRYIVYFTSDKQQYRLKTVRSDGDAAYISNSKKMDDWQTQFCTPELLSIMSRHQMDFVMGQVLAPNMAERDSSKLTTQCSG